MTDTLVEVILVEEILVEDILVEDILVEDILMEDILIEASEDCSLASSQVQLYHLVLPVGTAPQCQANTAVLASPPE